MNAIYFPFTYISEQTAKNFTAIFEQLTCYLPSTKSIPEKMKMLSENGLLDIRVPVEKDEEKLMALYKEYIEWGNIHQHNTISSLKHRTEDPFLYDDSWSAQLKTNIKNQSKRKSSQKKEPELTARIFLQVAQEYDRHHKEMIQDIQSIKTMERSLFKDLRADDFQKVRETAESLSTGLQDLGMYMTKERLSSWYALMKHDHALPSSVLITSSQGIWEHLLEFSPEAEAVEENFPVVFTESTARKQCKKLSELLSLLQKEKWSSSNYQMSNEKSMHMNETGSSLILYIIPDIPPEVYFARFAQETPDNVKADQAHFQNTIIGILQ
jgi:hypothetical protein